MSDSLHPTRLVCPKCRNAVDIQAPPVTSITYTCEACGELVEESFLTRVVIVEGDEEPSTQRGLGKAGSTS